MIDREARPDDYAMATRRFEEAKAARDRISAPPPTIIDIARRRGLRVEMFPSGAIRITGPGVSVAAASPDLVDLIELDPNIRYPHQHPRNF